MQAYPTTESAACVGGGDSGRDSGVATGILARKKRVECPREGVSLGGAGTPGRSRNVGDAVEIINDTSLPRLDPRARRSLVLHPLGPRLGPKDMS